MVVALAGGVCIVVAVDTVIRKATMIYACWQPGANGMTYVAFLSRLDVICIFTDCYCAIVAT